MTTTIPVTGDTAELGVAASLPVSFVPAPAGTDGSAAIVAGSAGWTARAAAAIRGGAIGVLVTAPVAEDAAELAATAAEAGVPVVLDGRWSANPVVDAASLAFTERIREQSRLEVRSVVAPGDDVSQALLDLISLVRALVGPAEDLNVLHRNAHGLIAEAAAADCALDVSVVRTAALPSHATVRLLTGDGSVDLVIPDGAAARPALLSVTDERGTTLAPTIYETGHRRSWRRLHQYLTSGQPVHDRTVHDIAAFQADLIAAEKTLSLGRKPFQPIYPSLGSPTGARKRA